MTVQAGGGAPKPLTATNIPALQGIDTIEQAYQAGIENQIGGNGLQGFLGMAITRPTGGLQRQGDQFVALQGRNESPEGVPYWGVRAEQQNTQGITATLPME